MNFLGPDAHSAVFVAATRRLGEILWHLLKAEQMMQAKCLHRIKDGLLERTEMTEFGQEVGRDEIHWWVFKKEDDLNALHSHTQSALEAAQRLRAASKKLKHQPQGSYEGLLATLRTFAEAYQADINAVHDYLNWLHGRNVLAPSILFTYRVWGTSRRSDRWFDVKGDSSDNESQTTMQILTELALGLRTGGVSLYALDRARLEVGGEIYERDPENSGDIEVPDDEVVARASWNVLDEFAVFFEWIRNSLQNVSLDISKCVAQRTLIHSDAFWRRFILAAVNTKKLETQLWDFKETLAAWRAKGTARNDAKVTFAEDVASFANADGGVLVVGISDKREIVGLGTGRDVESHLKFARDILAERLDYPRDIVLFNQVMVANRSGVEVLCLVITVATTMEAVGVADGTGQFTYPVRRETGISRESRRDINGAKVHAKSDNYDFIERLEQFVNDNSR